jgi:hypothetical protein
VRATADEERPPETEIEPQALHLAPRQLHEQFAVLPEAREQRARRRRVGLIYSLSLFGVAGGRTRNDLSPFPKYTTALFRDTDLIAGAYIVSP